MPVLDVANVRRSLAFYERLGFEAGPPWGEPPSFAICQRGDVTLALSLADAVAPLPVNHGWAAYIYVDDVEGLHAEFASEGVETSELRRPEHYGCDDFEVRDPDGHRIAFGQSRDPFPGPGLGTGRGRG